MNRLQVIRSYIVQQNTPISTKLLLEKAGSVAHIWLKNPKELNSLSETMMNELKTVFTHLNDENKTKIIVIRSKSQKAFCAGGNIKSFAQNDYSVYPHSDIMKSLTDRIRRIRKPIVSVVEGKALGGGFELALLSDIIICSDKAQFGFPEINLGLIPGMSGTQQLARIVGKQVAMRMIMTGETINAAEAHRLNIAHLLPADSFEAKLGELISTLANKASDSLYGAKKAIKVAFETTLDQGLEHETTIFHGLFNKKGAKEGITAFIEKRKPKFKEI